MNDPPASTEMPPLRIIGHWPPILRRATPTISWTRPAPIAQAPPTRSTAGIPEAAATPMPMVASVLIAMFTYSPVTEPAPFADRASTMADPTSNSGYRTTRTMPTAPSPDLVVRNTRTAHTMANANRTKYNRRSAGANPPTAGESTVVTMIPSPCGETFPDKTERSISVQHGARVAHCQDRTFYLNSYVPEDPADPRESAGSAQAQLRYSSAGSGWST